MMAMIQLPSSEEQQISEALTLPHQLLALLAFRTVITLILE